MNRLLLFLCAACCLSPAAATIDGLAKRQWIKAETPHFVVITEQPEAVARQVVHDLETLRYFRLEFGSMRALKVSTPLTVLAIGDQRTFAELELPKGWGGVFNLNLQGYSALANISNYAGESKHDSKARATLLHEYYHFLVRLTERTFSYPRWLDEGMAEYWATFNVDGSTVRLGDRVTNDGGSRDYGLYSYAGRATISTGTLFNTVDLALDVRDGGNMREMIRFYSEAYFAVHYFNSTPALRAALSNYLTMMNLGYRQDRAAQLAFKKSYEELDQDIISYATRRLAVRVLSPTAAGFAFPQPRPTITRLDAPGLYAQLARVLPNHRFPRKDVIQLLNRNRELNPDDGDANILPLLHGLESPTAVATIAHRFPNNPKLLTLRADMLRRQAEYMKDNNDPGWLTVAHKARDDYRQAIRADADYPSPYNGLGLLYQLLPASEPLQEAVAGFDTASIYTRDPETFRHLASTFIRMNKPMEALAALRGAVSFSKPALLGPEVLLLENTELLSDLTEPAKAIQDGLEYPGGTLYSGDVVDGKPEGRGKAVMQNGSYYQGSFVQGLPHGKGKLASDSGLSYEGEFERGFARGQGEVRYPAGNETISYKGQVDYMMPSGQGELVTRSGRYTGGFQDAAKHGAGEFTAAKAAVTLRGQWLRGGFEWAAADGIVFSGGANENGRRHGKGTCRAADTLQVPVPCEFKDGKLSSGRE